MIYNISKLALWGKHLQGLKDAEPELLRCQTAPRKRGWGVRWVKASRSWSRNQKKKWWIARCKRRVSAAQPACVRELEQQLERITERNQEDGILDTHTKFNWLTHMYSSISWGRNGWANQRACCISEVPSLYVVNRPTSQAHLESDKWNTSRGPRGAN